MAFLLNSNLNAYESDSAVGANIPDQVFEYIKDGRSDKVIKMNNFDTNIEADHMLDKMRILEAIKVLKDSKIDLYEKLNIYDIEIINAFKEKYNINSFSATYHELFQLAIFNNCKISLDIISKDILGSMNRTINQIKQNNKNIGLRNTYISQKSINNYSISTTLEDIIKFYIYSYQFFEDIISSKTETLFIHGNVINKPKKQYWIQNIDFAEHFFSSEIGFGVVFSFNNKCNLIYGIVAGFESQKQADSFLLEVSKKQCNTVISSNKKAESNEVKQYILRNVHQAINKLDYNNKAIIYSTVYPAPLVKLDPETHKKHNKNYFL